MEKNDIFFMTETKLVSLGACVSNMNIFAPCIAIQVLNVVSETDVFMTLNMRCTLERSMFAPHNDRSDSSGMFFSELEKKGRRKRFLMTPTMASFPVCGVLTGIELTPPDCSGSKVRGLHHRTTTPSNENAYFLDDAWGSSSERPFWEQGRKA